MGCTSCAKKGKYIPLFMRGAQRSHLDTAEWGPVFWKVLHSLAEHIGKMNNPRMDTDQAIEFQLIITSLPTVLPCELCQAHSRDYIMNNRPNWPGLYGDALRNSVRTWLFTFHNHVRTSIELPIVLHSSDECIAMYGPTSTSPLTMEEISFLFENLTYASRIRVIQPNACKKWITHLNRYRVLCGSI